MLLAGTRVTIRAADEFFAFVDGWSGTVVARCPTMGGSESGVAEVACIRPDGIKTFYVPWDQLEAVKS